MINKLDFLKLKNDIKNQQTNSSISINQACRSCYDIKEFELIIDSFDDYSNSIYSFRFLQSNELINRRFTLSASYNVQSCNSGGWFLISKDNSMVYWIPVFPVLRSLDDDGHILEEARPKLKNLDISKNEFSITLEQKKGYVLDVVMVELKAASMIDELSFFHSFERNPVFLWGSHTKYTKPEDLFHHFVHGHIYENRTSWPFYYRICSENDAHALYVTLNGLERNTGKKIYKHFKSLLVLAIISRQRADGGWYHGEWTTNMESHFRLHCSGMHLLMDSLSIQKNDVVECALIKSADFISKQRDDLEVGTWFLHDQLELNESSMNKSPFKWVKSHAYGKRVSNMLVLNTHLDATIALDRYASLTKDEQYLSIIQSARKSAKFVFYSKPAQWLYKPLFYIINLTLLPKSVASKLPFHIRALKRIGWKYLIPKLHVIKKYFPRINMPGGYIDRGLSLKGLSDAYQSINLMDLCRFIRRFPKDILIDDLQEALVYTAEGELKYFWQENKRKDYALGFWAEVNYHLCLQFKDSKYRQWLVDAINDLQRCNLGIIPSILGGNREASYSTNNKIWTEDLPQEIILADISTSEQNECLIINTSQSELSLSLNQKYKVIYPNETENINFNSKISIPALGWVSVI